MTPDQFLLLLEALRRLDRGEPAPRLSESLGSYLRDYERCRNDILKIALNTGVEINKRGEITGHKLGPMSAIPLTTVAAPQWHSSRFGALRNMLVICPEFMTVMDLRLWEGSASGHTCIRLLETLEDGQIGLKLSGGYRLLPPDRLLPGEADIEPLNGAPNKEWPNHEFLRFSGEDITRDPHPLEYRPVPTADEPRLAAIRVLAGLMESDSLLRVPWATSRRFCQVPVQPMGCTSTDAAGLLHKGNLLSCLVLREPMEETWKVWDAQEVDVSGMVAYVVSCEEHREYLRGMPTYEYDQLLLQALESVSNLGLDPTAQEATQVCRKGLSNIPSGFAVQVASYVRLRRNRPKGVPGLT